MNNLSNNPAGPFIEVLSDKAALLERAIALVQNKIHIAIEQRDRCTMVLAGGNTPKPLYEALAQASIPWEKLYIFWGDERYVPVDDPDSNQGMAQAAWLSKVPIPANHIFAMPTAAQNPAEDAQQYEQTLYKFFQISPGSFPAFDLVLLGMGDDGHTASLFPQTAALQVQDHLVTVGEKSSQPRITLTIPTLNQSHCVVFLVSGENKRPALSQIFTPTADEFMYPARFIQPQGELWWLLDHAAGAELAL